ncbi:hypothetical protein [Nocardia shimofusensis]|uniref:hypothetical protein n=1 Tax=Nocardia shimofusensis TaxID=228596 RepID=UPI0012ED5660|nr:hypothetical protein [Nocardia shimofusensis]
MLNDTAGAITPPGSRWRTTGFRTLDGSVGEAVHTLTVGSAADFWPRLTAELKVTTAATFTSVDALAARAADAEAEAIARDARSARNTDRSQIWEDGGDHARLRASLRRSSPIPAAVLDFARNGRASGDRWRAADGRLDRSAARQSVLATAALRGYSLADVMAELPANGGSWDGLANAYIRYGPYRQRALHRDWIAACRWVSQNAHEFSATAHKNLRHTGGISATQAETQRRWLAAALRWTDAQWPHSPKRWTVHAVLQAVAYASTLKPTHYQGSPTVEFGGRSLSLIAGGLPETTVWQTLRDIRAIAGAPLERLRKGSGLHADLYVLASPALDRITGRVGDASIARARVEAVSPAWRVLGLHCRRLYETILDGTTTPRDAFRAAGMAPSSGYRALATLTTSGLIQHARGIVRVGIISLDRIARDHGLVELRHTTITRHRVERARWASWLATQSAYPMPRTTRSCDSKIRSRSKSWKHVIAPVFGIDAPAVARECTQRRARQRGASLDVDAVCARAHDSDSADISRIEVDEIYVESSSRPRLGGRWLVSPRGVVRYQRPTGVVTASVAPAALLRTSPDWRQLKDLRLEPIESSDRSV